MRTYQHTAFTVLNRYIYCTADTKATPASVQGVGDDCQMNMEFASPQRCETYT